MKKTQKRSHFLWILFFLLVSTQVFLVCMDPARAADTTTITINPDGSITPATPLLSTSDYRTYYLTGNVSLVGYAPFCELRRSNIVIDGNGHEIQGTGDNVGFVSAARYQSGIYTLNVTFRNLIMKNVGMCIDFTAEYVRGLTVTHCYFSAPWIVKLSYWAGINGYDTVSDNEFVGSGMLDGWELQQSVICRNVFSGSSGTSSLSLTNAANSTIYENIGPVGIDLRNGPNAIITNNTLVGTGDYSSTGISVSGSANTTITKNTISNFGKGISAYSTSQCVISENTVYGILRYALETMECPNIVVSKNVLRDSNRDFGSGGMYVTSNNATILDNVISNNGNGITIGSYPSIPNCKIYHNHFINNSYQARIISGQKPPEGAVVWDNGYPSGGNYWSDYTGVDSNFDAIGDMPYIFKGDSRSTWGGRDRFPRTSSPYYGPETLLAFFNYTLSPDYLATFDGSLSSASNSTIVRYEWSFGDGATAVGKIVTHKYNTTGGTKSLALASASQTEPAFSATLKVTNNKGSTNQITRTITRGNLKAVAISPAQVFVDDSYFSPVPLVYFKATDFQISYESTFCTDMEAVVKLEAPGFLPDIYEFSYRFAPGSHRFIIGRDVLGSQLFWPIDKPGVRFRFTIDPYNVTDETDETDNCAPATGFEERLVNATKGLRVLFVPVRFKNEDGYPGMFNGYSRAVFIEHAVSSMEYIKATYPVAESGFGVSYDCSCFNSPVTAKIDGEEQERPTTKEKANEVLGNLILQLAGKAGTNFDRVVGVGRPGWFDGIPGYNGSQGFAMGFISPLAAVVTVESWATTAHEIAHTYGLWVPPLPHPELDQAGYYVMGRTDVYARTWMSTRPKYRLPVPAFWVSRPDYRALVEQMIDPTDPETLFINARFWRNSTVELGNWYRYKEGFPTHTERDTGNYSIVQLDGSKNVLSVVGFNVTFESLVCEHPETVFDMVPVAFTIPCSNRTRTIQIQDRLGNVVASKTVSNNPPSIHVTSPNGGETLKSSQTQISWTASDPDGDRLSYNLLVSDDGGSTWDPVVTGLNQTTHNLILTGFSGGNKYLVKVVACDGVNTAEDTSDGYFSIASFTATMMSLPQTVRARGAAYCLLKITSYGNFSSQITLNATSSTTSMLNFTWDGGATITPVINGSTFVLLDVQTLTKIQRGNHTLYLTATSGNNTEVAVTYLYVESYGSITINNGAAYTNSTSVALELTAIETKWGQVRFSNDGASWSGWEDPSGSRNWTLLSGDGVKSVYYLVQDDNGLTETYNATIILDTTPPVANAGQNQNVQVNTKVTFDGSGSTDNTGITGYLWDFGDGANGTGIAPVHTYSAVGNYAVRLTVKDAAGNTATSSATVSINVVIPEFQPGALLIFLVIVALTFALAGPKKGKLGR